MEEDGPDIELGAGEEVAYRVRACLDGADGDLWVRADVEASTLVVPTDNVPFNLAITVEALWNTFTETGPVPFDRELNHESGDNKDDAGEGGAIEVTWSLRASIDRTEHTVAEDAPISITIEPEP